MKGEESAFYAHHTPTDPANLSSKKTKTTPTTYLEKSIPEKQITTIFTIYKVNPFLISGESMYLGKARKDAAVHL